MGGGLSTGAGGYPEAGGGGGCQGTQWQKTSGSRHNRALSPLATLGEGDPSSRCDLRGSRGRARRARVFFLGTDIGPQQLLGENRW